MFAPTVFPNLSIFCSHTKSYDIHIIEYTTLDKILFYLELEILTIKFVKHYWYH